MKARIGEVFESFQGEGLYVGERQVFVRFFGCNLSCSFCDTRLDTFFEYGPQELFEEIALYGDEIHSVAFTGGEPLLQTDFLREIMQLTRANGYRNYLETNGTLAGELKEVIRDVDIIAMDLKLPSSTGMPGLWGLHRRFLKIAGGKKTFIKIVICEGTKEDDLMEAIALIKEVNRSLPVILQPNSFDNKWLLEEKIERFNIICNCEGIASCVMPQMHKLIGIR